MHMFSRNKDIKACYFRAEVCVCLQLYNTVYLELLYNTMSSKIETVY